jgi:Ca-activated chloride channel family protein
VRLASPEALALLLLLPLLLWWTGGARCRPALPIPRSATWSNFGTVMACQDAPGPALPACAGLDPDHHRTRPAAVGGRSDQDPTGGIAIAMVIDVSGSMAALDLQISDRQANRLDVVKETFRDFVAGDKGALPGREGDIIGMITFARYADVMSPLTLDHKALIGLLEQVEIVQLPEEDGTAIGDGMVAGIEQLRGAAGVSKVMILLTDGSHNAGDAEPIAAAQIASALGIKVYTICAGTRGIALMPSRNRDGINYVPGQVFIDEFTLERVVAMTGGRYFRATDAAALRAIYGEIDRLEGAACSRELSEVRGCVWAAGGARARPAVARDRAGQHPPAHGALGARAGAVRRLRLRISARPAAGHARVLCPRLLISRAHARSVRRATARRPAAPADASPPLGEGVLWRGHGCLPGESPVELVFARSQSVPALSRRTD